jgi:glutathione S-transferase
MPTDSKGDHPRARARVPELLALPFSPWSEKARWALDARRVPYRYRLFVPLLGEPMLRIRLRRWTGPVTVPVLTDDDGATFADSADIARWADTRGEGPRMFPPEHEAAIARYVQLSEEGLAAGRGVSLRRMLVDEEALREMVPKAFRKRLGPLSARLGGYGIARTLRKYGAGAVDAATHQKTLVFVLEELRGGLARAPATAGVAKTLLGSFTFADVAMAQVLVFVEPPRFGLRLGPASRRSFGDPALRERFADLVAWRDALYEAYRPHADRSTSDVMRS